MHPFAITMGDPAGIGPEIILKMAGDARCPEAPYVVIGDVSIMERAAHSLGVANAIERVERVSDRAAPGRIAVLQVGPLLPADLPNGQVNAACGRAAAEYVQAAVDLALNGQVSAIVTAPLNKEAMRLAGICYPGHTELLADRCGSPDVAMMLANDELRVLLVSVHLSLVDAIGAVTIDAELRAIRLADQACRQFGIARPRIAVAGLNPHAGENGLFGAEERDIIGPAIEIARRAGIGVEGPFPPDTVFMRARRGEFDIVVAQYHDQGLIPVKYRGIDDGVNVTVGLPFVRTSVDHGTAFDIAGKGVANSASILGAFKCAIALTAARPTSGGAPTFIFMLTRADRTIRDAHERLADALAAGVKHIGFKDVGLPELELRELSSAIKAGGATSYLEVVSLDRDSEIASATFALDAGIDVLMGGTDPDAIAPIIAGAGIRYYPFVGRVYGAPSVLNGSIEQIAAHAASLSALPFVDGLDLLAYRSDCDPQALIAAVCQASSKPVIVAGSIDSIARLQEVKTTSACAFTIGTAVLDGAFASEGNLARQLSAVQLALNHS